MKSLHGILIGTLLLIATAAQADIVILRDGTEFDGKILKETDREVVIQTRSAKLTLQRSEIKEIRREKISQEKFEEKFSSLKENAKSDNAQAWIQLADWAHDEKLYKEERRALEEAIKIDPENKTLSQRLVESKSSNRANLQVPDPEPAEDQNDAGATKKKNPGSENLQALADKPMMSTKFPPRECPTCKGNGVLSAVPGHFAGIPCYTCKNTGKIDRAVTRWGVNIPDQFTPCATCDATGSETWMPCEKCGNTEHPGVRKFGGKRYYPCMDCKGYGSIPGPRCKNCKGQGYHLIKRLNE